jgi:TolB-like protein
LAVIAKGSTAGGRVPEPELERQTAVFAASGEYWTLGYSGATFPLKDVKGLSYIWRLLRHPGEELHALDLLHESGAVTNMSSDGQVLAKPEGTDRVGGLGDAGEMLDPQAKKDYQRRYRELNEVLEDLRERGEHERAEKVESELEFLRRELVRATGLGGRDRRAGSAAERARINVTRAIKAALQEIAEQHAGFGELLDSRIRTGGFCSYDPDPHRRIIWQFSIESLEPQREAVAAEPLFSQPDRNSHGVGPIPPAAESSAPRLSIVVLPFANIGSDPEQEYFVDGVTESLTTDLSRIAGSFVIARNSAFSYRDKSPGVRQIGHELGVRYVLEGSVQRGDNRMRVNVQLIDAENGNHLWAERFDKPVPNPFDMQDEIVARLAGQLGTQLVEAEARRAERSPHPDSMDLCFRGVACMHKGWSPENLVKARGFFERALALDPNSVEALVGEAAVDVIVGTSSMIDNPAARFAAAGAALTKALSLAPNYALAHLVLGAVHNGTGRGVQAIAACERALALDRNLASAYVIIGTAKFWLGRAEETEGHIVEALRLNPLDNVAYTWMSAAGIARFLMARDEEAVAWLRRSTEANRNWPLTHFWLSAALAHLGRFEEARASAQAGLALDPSFTLNRVRAGRMPDNPTYLAEFERVYNGLRMAGVPE